MVGTLLLQIGEVGQRLKIQRSTSVLGAGGDVRGEVARGLAWGAQDARLGRQERRGAGSGVCGAVPGSKRVLPD